MSRIGKMDIQIPEAVNISLGPGIVEIKGPKGNIEFLICAKFEL